MEHIRNWLSEIEQTCRKINHHYIDILIDQCGMEFSVIPALSGFSSSLAWCSLYEGIPEDIYREDAPLLIRIDLDEPQQVQWLSELAREVALTAPLLLIVSPWPFSALAKWLRQCVDASHEGLPGIFRFWDTRIFPWLFNGILTAKAGAQLLRPALFWSWIDRDDNPAILAGKGAAYADEIAQQITFSDAQFEAMMCLSDAILFLKAQHLPENIYPTKEELFSACFNAMLEATKKKILFEEDRDAWVLAGLSEYKKYNEVQG
ncbi:hypothetical protein D3C75_542330 [compost metagenome]